MISSFHAVIPAGGSGTRLWPLSRCSSPKFLHDVLGTGRSLLQATWDRVEPLAGPERTWVVTGAAHARAVADQLPQLSEANLVTEPSPRDSAAAIGLAAMLIHDREPDAVMGSFAADHSITNEWEFRHVIEQAVAAAAGGDIVTIGITPTYPSTAYGYIRTGEALGLPGAPTARRAREFVEKPAAGLARRYAYSGRYRWNAGMFIARADALLDQFARRAPELSAALRTIADAWNTPEREAVVAQVWPRLEKKAIDYVLAEGAAAEGQVVVVPGDFGWDDVGDFDSVAKLRQPLPGEPDSVHAIGRGDVVDIESSGIVFCDEPKVVALVGVDDVIVVDSGDALLVASRAHAQDVKRAVARAREIGRADVL
ncbi:mannose-1-phosphate guanylyltransferase [Brevibacterium sp. 5221]|uniref:Mannose-1-phosphate guanylyltransferase n=1 Tax=Brevibacterium rongguiense TaxID=2695267 RepID=A0A6N9H2X7_9MICO|nr:MULTISPECIES: mannose-1-phosphate guanylyltransferase [Brevibacterium]MYM18410.1 mannose-1-phosphate guanylyltransferase [Brevibacterium rongguiense]WAL41451.1 mannose-1-phosphate guanylyltransferase [Brevibacterium sp. BRM-1]